ncbi:MAG: T9SS type A sorting domain-containing protein [Bacteroidia bacterium]|nr:T9SS type A sorting domain-containing protein [Bacteroidia bacterium]
MYGVGSGGVTFNIDAGHTETFTSPFGGTINTSGSVANPIVFQKTGNGANPLLTAAKGISYYDGIIVISGGDNITFDGIDLRENPLNSTDDEWMESGFAILKANEDNGSKNITIKNCKVELNKNNGYESNGIFVNNFDKYFDYISVNSNAGKTENVIIQNTIIQNTTYGILLNSDYPIKDNNFLIQGNRIDNFVYSGIRLSSVTNATISSNKVSNGSGSSPIRGIDIAGDSVLVVEKNQITNLTSSFASYMRGIVVGINAEGGESKGIFRNNSISNLNANNATGSNAVIGIYSYSEHEFYNNSVFLSCNSGGIGFGSVAFFASYVDDCSIKMSNNIFINKSTYGKVVAYYRLGTNLTTYLSPSDYNLFYAGTPSANNLIFHDGTNSDQTLTDYKTRMATRDQNSYTGMVNFITGDSLRPIAADYKNGTTISGVTEDIAGTARKATPNIGAYEGYPANYWVGVTSTDPTGRSNWGDSTVPAGTFPLTVDSLSLFSPNMLSNWSLTNLILPAGKTLSLNGFNLSISGTITGAGKLVGNALSSVTITGTGNLGNLYFDQTTPGTTNRIKDFTLNRGTNKLNGGAVLGNTMEVTGTLTATTGTLNANGNLVLVSNVSGTARIAQLPATGDVTGNVTAQRYIPAVARRYRMIASPLQNFTFSQLADDMFVTGPGGISNGFDASNNNSPSIFTYQEANPGRGWKGLTNITNTLDDAMGSFVFVRGDRTLVNWYNPPYPSQNIVTIDFSGQPINKGTYAPNLTYTNTGTPGDDGWNLVGNPYPSQIDWTALSSTNLSSFYYMYNPATGSYESDNGTKYIAMGQAFFVQATGSSPTLVFYESSKTASAPTNYFKTGNSILNARMVKDSLNSDLLSIRFVQGSTVNYSPTEDAIKFTNSTINFASLTNNDSIMLQHNIMPEPSVAYDTVKLYADAPNGSYSLEFSNLASIDLKYHVLLLDKYTNTTTNLRTTPSYTFSISANASTKGSERFAVIFANQSALPVTLVAFSGSKQQQNAELEWNTASEKNTSHFVVERSMDGKEWEKAGVVASQGATAGSKYSYTDANVFAKAQQWYYRLQIVDRDKTNSYSKIIRIEDQTQAAEVVTSIYPIPTQGELYIETAGTASAGKVDITDAMGKLVLSKEYTKTGQTIALTIDHLEMGVYMLKYTEEGKVTVRKIIKR